VAEIHSLVFGAEDPLPPVVDLLALLKELPPDMVSEIVKVKRGSLQR
jgi:hypothetical protein